MAPKLAQFTNFKSRLDNFQQ